jgi:hypothetical protein
VIPRWGLEGPLALSQAHPAHTWCLNLPPLCPSSSTTLCTLLPCRFCHTTSQQTSHCQLHISHQVHLPFYLYPIVFQATNNTTTVVSDLSITQITGSPVALATWRLTTGGICIILCHKDPLLLIQRFVFLSFQPATPSENNPKLKQNGTINALSRLLFD